MYIEHVDEQQEYFFKEGCHILELLNTPEDPDVSVARARVEPGITTKPHRLNGLVERYVVLEGTGQVCVGNKQEMVKVGSSVVIPKGERQCIKNTGSNDLVLLAICSPRFELQYYEELE